MAPRIALFIPSLNGGGAERVAIFVGRYLEAYGYTVDLVTANGVGALASDPWAQAHLVDLGWKLELLALPPWLAYLRRAKPNLVISMVHSANFLSGIGAWLVPGVPVIVSIHNTLTKRPADQWWVRRVFGFGPERRLYRRAALVQTVSEELADQAHRLFAIPRERLVNTYNTAERGDAVAPSGVDGAEIAAMGDYLVSVGRLTTIKGFDRLIDAFSRADVPAAFRLVILGEGPERSRLEAQVARLGLAGRVLLPGFRDPVMPWLEGARGFVLATHGEGFGLVVAEALMAGIPVASTRAPGVTEVLDGGRIGRLIEQDDAAGIIRAIEDIAAARLEAPDRETLDAHLARFSSDAVGRRYVAMIERVLAGKARRG